MGKPKQFKNFAFSHEMRLGYEQATALFDAIKLLVSLGVITRAIDTHWNPTTGHVVITWEED